MTDDQKKQIKELRKKAKAIKRTPAEHRHALRYKVKFFYDLQRLRMQTAGRQHSDKIDLHEVDKTILEFRAKGLHEAEKNALKDIEDHLKTDKFYMEILSDKKRFKGIGPTMSGVILSEFDIHSAETASTFWSYAGLAPVPSRRCKVCQTPVDKKGDIYKHAWAPQAKGCKAGNELKESDTFPSGRAMRPTKGQKLPYNAWLKTKLVGVMGSCLLKANSPWRKFYDDYKHRKESAGWGASDGHRHNAAVRYMVKMVLLEIWKEWRAMEGLPVRESYQEGYLGHKHAS